MTNKEKLQQLEVCIYMQPWWLDIVAKNSWDVVVSEKGGAIRGVWVYVYKKKYLLNIISMPSLTKYNGIHFFYPENQKQVKKYSFEHKVTEELLRQFPVVDGCTQTFSPDFSNHLGLRWNGYKQTTNVTYKLETQTKTIEELWSGVLETTRKQVRKAEKSFFLEIGDEYDVLAVNRALFKRKSIELPFEEETFLKVVKASVDRSQGVVLSLKENTLVVASAWFIWDKNTLYYQGGSAFDGYTTSGAMSKLLWEGIKIAQEMKLTFDFEGSMIPSIERFFRSFGANQTPYYVIKKDKKIIELAKFLFNK